MTKLKKFFLISYNLFIIVLTIILIRNFPTSLTGHHSVYDPFIEQILNSAELDKPIRTNSYGFKDYEWNITKPNNTIRIIALGDSFTEGFGVDVNETWPKQLEAMLNNLNLSVRFEVFNMGQGGWGTYEEVEAFKIIGLQFEPDIVILQYHGNDFETPEFDKEIERLVNEYLNGEQDIPEYVEEAFEKTEDEYVLYIYFTYVYFKDKDFDSVWSKNVEPYLRELVDLLKKEDIEFVMFAVDFGSQTKYDLLSDFAEKQGIDIYNFNDLLSPPSCPSDTRLPDCHPNPHGHKLIAERLLPLVLEKLKLV